ncbi:MAG: glycosyl transferase [Anaerolineae bacterium]|nr:glycosyl transferase [Anaerolineae bacterium]
MNYGYFDAAAREYVITDPKTPVKWINYIGTLAFGGFVDHTGGVVLCKGDPALNRITKYIAQLPDADFKGATLYLRFPEGEGYRVFSPFYTPALTPYTAFSCRVGLGYNRITSEMLGIRTDVTIFVPEGGTQELRLVRVTNLRATPVTLEAIPVVEYTHPDALKQLTNADWVPQTMTSRIVDEGQGYKTLLQYPFMYRDSKVNYFTASLPVSAFESDRARFLGRYGTWAAPQALQQPTFSDYEALRGDNIAALLLSLGELAPGETRVFVTQLGQADSFAAAQPNIICYRDPAAAEAALTALARFWDGYLSRMQVATPSAAMNAMLNVHNPRQVFTTLNWSRYLSLYQLGFGARGIGFRDTSQDMMGAVVNAPERVKALLEKLLHVQLRDGSAMHQFNPLTMIASRGDAAEMEDRPKFYGDDHLWIVLAVTAYLKETGDLAFLDQNIPFYDKAKTGEALESAPVWEHLQRAVHFTRTHVGAHGLPLLGFADWNDTVNLRTGAESLFNANLYGKALLELATLAKFRGDVDTAAIFMLYYSEMAERVNAVAWDGSWYVRYFDADGAPLGAHNNAQGQIYANGQSWPIISGFATEERARMALDAVYERLNTANGIKLSAPGFNGYDPHKGGVTTYPPGAKENGGIFLHANPWVMIAETLIGRGDRAFAYYEQINPAAKNERIEVYESEPYVYPQNILADEHPQFGLARNGWLTGTASWAYQAGVQYILGVRPTYTGLEIDPCIPASWEGFRMRRVFRDATYEIEVRNPQHVCRGVKRIWVDGMPVAGTGLPIFADAGVHQVVVELG